MGTIPPEAKRVFKGVIFDVYQWEQTLYDGSTTTFELLKRHDSSVVIGTNGDKILVAHDQQPHRPPVVTLPGGAVDDGETPVASAQRELLEETGYASDQWEPLFTFEPSAMVEWTVHFFLARNLTQTANPHPGPGELIELQWVTFEKFLQISRRPNFQNRDLAFRLYGMNPEELEQFRHHLFDA